MNTTATADPVTRARAIGNFVGFQLGWFACVGGAARGMHELGAAIAALIVAVNVATAVRPVRELKLIGCALAIGIIWDSSLLASGTLTFTSGLLMPHIAPPWILALWALFASTLNVSLRWLRGRIVVAVVLGAVAGPLSYWAGVRMGAVEFTQPVVALVALALGWAVFTPLLMVLSARYDGMQEAR